MKKLILIDSNALVHRAFHALPPSLSQKGVMTNAVFGFTSVLIKMLKDLNPDYVIATFDLAGKTFRHDEFAEYKIHRVKAPDELYTQIPLIKKVLAAFGMPVFEYEGFEADDLIGALSEQAKKNPDIQTVIVTGDLDTLQLVDKDKVVVFTLRKGITDTVTYNEKEVKKRYDLEPDKIIDLKGLKGDPSDNIPGVPGVGEKTAAALIKEFGSIENMYKELETETEKGKIKSKKKTSVSEKLKEKLLANKDTALFSKKLATIRTDVPVKLDISHADWRNNASIDALTTLFKEFGFLSLSKRLPELFSSAATNAVLPLSASAPALFVSEKIGQKETLGLELAKLSKADSFVFDIADNCLFFTTDGEIVKEIDLKDLNEKQNPEFWNLFSSIFSDGKIKKSGYDLKPQIKKLMEQRVEVKGIDHDIRISAWLLNPDMRDYSLERIYSNEVGGELEQGGAGRIIAMFNLQRKLEKRLEKEKLETVFRKIEIPLIPILAKMELIGIKIDSSCLATLAQVVAKEISDLEKEIHNQAGTSFNINSPSQLSEVLFTRLGIKGKIKKTSKGAISTAAGELEKLVGVHPIIDSILRYREVQKIKSTYIDPFPKLVDPKTGRIHTFYNQTGASTGRLSSQDPNLQNIPIRSELGQEFRRSFVAQPGYKLVSFDYTQLELRIAAHIAKDSKMIAAFKRGEDIHTRTAAEIFNVEPKAVTSNMRRQAKAMNFGLIYGMGILGFQRASGVDREKARNFIDAYMQEFSGIAKFMETTKREAKKNGYVETIFGRKRLLPEIRSGVPQLVAQAERIAINMPIQGTEADFMKIAMIEVQGYIDNNFKGGEVRMLLQVHDELLFEIKNSLVEEVVKKVSDIMENVYKLDVPLTVEAKSGDNWRDMESL